MMKLCSNNYMYQNYLQKYFSYFDFKATEELFHFIFLINWLIFYSNLRNFQEKGIQTSYLEYQSTAFCIPSFFKNNF